MNKPIELTESELDMVSGGNRGIHHSIVQANSARVSIGNGNYVTTGSGGSTVDIGDNDSVYVDQSNSNSGSVS
jgi:hypothetical protein